MTAAGLFIPAGPVATPSFSYSHGEWKLADISERLYGGYLEAVYLGSNQVMYVDEDGKGKNLPLNILATALVNRIKGQHIIVGNAIVLGFDNEGETVSVDPEVAMLVCKIATSMETIGAFNELA